VPNNVEQQIKERFVQDWNEGEIVEMFRRYFFVWVFKNRWNDSMGTSIEWVL